MIDDGPLLATASPGDPDGMWRVTQRYRLVEQEDRFIIVSSRDPRLGWSGQHWVDRERTTGAHAPRFADEDAAEDYA